jgi:hypothetical protein
MKSQLQESELSAYRNIMNKKEWQLHLENMRRLVVSISEMFDALSMSNSRKEIWILTSSPALGNLTLRLGNLTLPSANKAIKDTYTKFNKLLSNICEKGDIPVHLICFGDTCDRGKKTISEFYIEAKTSYLKLRTQLGLSEDQIEISAHEALDEARALIQKMSPRKGRVELRQFPDLSIWAYEIKDNSRVAKCRAIFYLNVKELLPINIQAFNVCDTKLAEYLISIARAKENKEYEDQKNSLMT